MVYVDDIIVTGNNKGTIDNIISQLGSAFALKDLGSLNYFLGIEIVSHVSGILLSPKKYIWSYYKVLVFLTAIPLGSLQYVTLSRPDIAFAVNKVCQYMHAPTENNWSAVKRILRYLHGMVEHGVLIRHSSGSTLQAFTDVLWKGTRDDEFLVRQEQYRFHRWHDQKARGGIRQIPTFDALRCNDQRLLTITMEKDIRNSVRYAKTATEIWKDLKERCGKRSDPPRRIT
ncbi:retrovirus-related pol polyprotein from transposon TNT 1-94 [Tanacetum coccineum]